MKIESVPGDRRGLLAAAALFALLAFVFACHVFPITDTDIWWHLSAARWMWRHGAVPRTDPFCTASLGAPWIDAQWGFQLMVYALWKLGGDFALVAAKAAAAAGIFALVLWRAWNGRTAPFLAALAAYAAFHGRYLTDIRPLWATLLLLATQYRCLRDAWDAHRPMPWLRLIALQLILVQMQGLFWLGPVQAAALCLGEALNAGTTPPARWGFRRVASVLRLPAGLFFAGLANPFGWRGWIFPLRLLRRILPVGRAFFSREVAENIPYWRWFFRDPAAAYPFILLAAAAGGLLMLVRRRARGEALLLAVYGGLGLMAQRNLPLFLLAVLIASARALQIGLPAKAKSSVRPGWRAAAAFCWVWTLLHGALFAADLHLERRWEIPGSWETPFRFPAGAVAYLRQHPLHGVLFNEIRHGGYLGWQLTGLRPFVDGRMILHDTRFWGEFLDLFDHPDRFAAYRRKYHIDIVLLPIGEDARYQPLAAYLARTQAMTTLYCDGAEVLLASDSAWNHTGGAVPEPWTPAAGIAEAVARFGKNPRLLHLALLRLAAWERVSTPKPAATGFSQAGRKAPDRRKPFSLEKTWLTIYIAKKPFPYYTTASPVRAI